MMMNMVMKDDGGDGVSGITNLSMTGDDDTEITWPGQCNAGDKKDTVYCHT